MVYREKETTDDPVDIETDLIDLANCKVDEIRDMRSDHLAPYTEQALNQVEQLRFNVGGSGPPGRAD